MGESSNAPVISIDGEDHSPVSIEIVDYLTTQIRDSVEPPFPEVRKHLADLKYNLSDVCVVWVTPLGENSEMHIIYTRDETLATFDLRFGELINFEDISNEIDCKEYIEIGKEYFESKNT